MKTPSKQKIILSLFAVIACFISLQIPFSTILGANARFTLFDFFAPSLSGIISLPLTLIAIIAAQISNIFLNNPAYYDWILIARIFPSVLSAYIFSRPKKINTLLFFFGIFLFAIHPIGNTAFPYSFLWLIPIITSQFPQNLFARSLTATFSAHILGSLIFLYGLNLPKEIWLALIPQVILERLLFASGICAFYSFFSLLRFKLLKINGLKIITNSLQSTSHH